MAYNDVLGGYPLTFALFTVGAGGWLAVMTGHALAATWRPLWQVVPYALLLGAAERFFNYALFGGRLLSVSGFVADSAVLVVVALAVDLRRKCPPLKLVRPRLIARQAMTR